jgi:16S rRNA G966 N2-methylase RsmD
VEELDANPINPRTLKEKAFLELKASLEKDPHFLKARPVIVSMEEGRENTVIAGNQRLTAAKALGWKTIPVMEVRGASEEQEREWMVKDNLHKGEWDFEKLANGFDLDFLKDVGFDMKELDKILSSVDNSADDEFDAEKGAEAITEPVTKLGDIWLLGEHRVMCGDSTKVEDVERLMDGKKADMAYCDPPYGMSVVKKDGKNNGLGDTSNGTVGVKGSANRGVYAPVLGDESTATAIASFGVCRGLGITTLVFWGANFYAEALPPSSGWICWDKENGEGFFADGELAWTNEDKQLRIFKHQWKGMIRKSERGQKRVHPTQKPVDLAAWVFENYGSPVSVLDLFLGSGSTLIACENTRRVCYGMELSEKYCDVIVKRWEEKTGKKACKI